LIHLAAYEPLAKQKAPKVLADAVTWFNTALMEFGVGGLALRNLIEFLKAALQNSNAAVRTSATKTLVTVRLFAGSGALFFFPGTSTFLRAISKVSKIFWKI
jgi:cytoskeleton-associated protein 5